MLWTQEYRRWIRRGPVLVGLVALAMSGIVVRSQPLAEKEASPESKRAALLLQRATYGPRPGDFVHILEMGTEAWLDEQLHPERIDDRKLDTTLARFSDLEMSTTELMQKYPRPSRAEQEAMQQDTHFNQGAATGQMPNLMRDLAGSISSFFKDLGPEVPVTLLTMTEFGRTVAVNGAGGTDHGHGTAMMVMGRGYKAARWWAIGLA